MARKNVAITKNVFLSIISDLFNRSHYGLATSFSLKYVSIISDVCVCDSSMVIRDLTLRSAASFGSFHLIRLLYDEYMFYIVEHKVAAAMQETSIAVMADYRQVALSAA